jgi:hypothetical protein
VQTHGPPASATLGLYDHQLIIAAARGAVGAGACSSGVVDIKVHSSGDGCIGVAVSDNGIGIAASDMPRLFDIFDRLGHQSSSIEGSGIGLALSRRLVVLMGGRLDVDSTAGLGITFTVDLPEARTAADSPMPQAGTGHVPGRRTTVPWWGHRGRRMKNGPLLGSG